MSESDNAGEHQMHNALEEGADVCSRHTITATELSADPIIRAHLSALYDTLLEQNLLRIIEPYSCVEIEHVAKGVQQPVREVEVK